MTALKIIKMGHPTLRREAAAYPVDKIGSPDFVQLVADMKETMHLANGIGLAAPQVDVPFRIAVIEIPEDGTRYGDFPALPFAVYVNPTITVLDEGAAGYWEGCLSVPGMMGFVERPQHIRVDYLDGEAKPRSLEVKGFAATVFQHEFDHLFGTLYVDRIKDMTLFVFEEEYHEYYEGTAPVLEG